MNKTVKKGVQLAIAACLMTGCIWAQSVFLKPYFGYRLFSSTSSYFNSVELGGRAQIAIDSRWRLEGGLGYIPKVDNTPGNPSVKSDVFSYSVRYSYVDLFLPDVKYSAGFGFEGLTGTQKSFSPILNVGLEWITETSLMPFVDIQFLNNPLVSFGFTVPFPTFVKAKTVTVNSVPTPTIVPVIATPTVVIKVVTVNVTQNVTVNVQAKPAPITVLWTLSLNPSENVRVVQFEVPNFNDIQKSWVKPYMAELAKKGILQDFTMGLFEPTKPVTKFEAVQHIKRIYAAKGLKVNDIVVPIQLNVSSNVQSSVSATLNLDVITDSGIKTNVYANKAVSVGEYKTNYTLVSGNSSKTLVVKAVLLGSDNVVQQEKVVKINFEKPILTLKAIGFTKPSSVEKELKVLVKKYETNKTPLTKNEAIMLLAKLMQAQNYETTKGVPIKKIDLFVKGLGFDFKSLKKPEYKKPINRAEWMVLLTRFSKQISSQ